MKALFFVLLALAAAGALYVSRTASEQVFEQPDAQLVFAPAPQALLVGPGPGEALRQFEVANMCCTNCTGKLYASLLTVEGVRAASVSFEQSRADVVCDAGLSEAQLLSALNFDKYEAAPLP